MLKAIIFVKSESESVKIQNFLIKNEIASWHNSIQDSTEIRHTKAPFLFIRNTVLTFADEAVCVRRMLQSETDDFGLYTVNSFMAAHKPLPKPVFVTVRGVQYSETTVVEALRQYTP